MTRRTHGYTMLFVLVLGTLFFLFLVAAIDVQMALHRHNQRLAKELQAKAAQLHLPPAH